MRVKLTIDVPDTVEPGRAWCCPSIELPARSGTKLVSGTESKKRRSHAPRQESSQNEHA